MKHKTCYGTMFQKLPGINQQSDAHEFAVTDKVKSHGLAIPDHIERVNIAAWDDCVACVEFETCYKLATARLLVKAASAAT